MGLRAVVYFIVKNPSAYRKLMDEIDEADRVGKLSEMVEFNQGQQLQYL
jgi:hypothetical protein